MIYMDSSALVKKYFEEKGSEKIKSLLEGNVAITSKLAYPELLSAFTRKHRSKDISGTDYRRALNDLESDWTAMLIIDFQDELFPIIKRTLEKYHLKGADSVHLSSALWLEEKSKQDIVFVASDFNLLKAAKAEKLKTLNPQDDLPTATFQHG